MDVSCIGSRQTLLIVGSVSYVCHMSHVMIQTLHVLLNVFGLEFERLKMGEP